MKYLLLLTSLLWSIAQGTVLGDAAASMGARSFKTLQPQGLSTDLIPTRTDYRCLFRNANNAVYNPVTEEVLFVGAPKAAFFQWSMADGCLARDNGTEWSFIVYDAKTDTFKSGPVDPFFSAGAFDCAALDRIVTDPATGDMYFCATMDSVLKYGSGAWSRLPASGVGRIEAAAFFTEMNGIAAVTAAGSVILLDLTSNQWRTLGTISGGQFKLAEYNPVLHAVLLTGGRGSCSLWKLDTAGNIIPLNDSPFQLDVTQCLLTCDPASGDFLVLRYDSLYGYDMTGQGWEALKLTPGSPNFTAQKAVAFPLPGMGAVAFLTAFQWPFILYKHGASIAVEKNGVHVKADTRLENRPNPFTSTVTLSLTGDEKPSLLAVYDVRGRMVANLTTRFKDGSATWHAAAPAGMYFIRAEVDGKRLVKPAFLIK